jgi:hypothetical protein
VKTCKKCGEIKALELFNKSARYVDGYSRYCKICTAEWSRRYRERHPDRLKARYQNNKEAYIAKAKVWKAANPDKVKIIAEKYRNTDKHKEIRQAWNKANKEKLLENSRRWAKANPERRRQIVYKWNDKNKLHVTERCRKWRIANKEKRRTQSIIRAKKEADSLSDRYVRYSLLGFTIADNVPKELIEAKRLEMLIKRRIKDEKRNRITQ